MSPVRFAIEQKDGTFTYPPPFYKDPPILLSPPPPSSSSGNRISPAVLFVIVILAVLFFISGLLHLLVRFLTKHHSSSRSNSRYPEISTSDALQRQLQQLFHLNDSGLDQAFIDALPVFHYKEMVGGGGGGDSKEPFDCAVCLCEFSEKDKLRLLPMCSHAFHINCIDTWLQSNSTCPLCRGTLFSSPGFSMENPMFDYFDDLREDEECVAAAEKAVEVVQEIVVEKGVLPVRLGKFKRLDNAGGGVAVAGGGGGESSSSNLDARRCFSMGSYQYVLGSYELRVPFCKDRQRLLKPRGKESQEQIGGDSSSSSSSSDEKKKVSSSIVVAKGESFSVSKIWLWPKKDAQRRLPSSSLNVDDLPKLPWLEDHKKLENGER